MVRDRTQPWRFVALSLPLAMHGLGALVARQHASMHPRRFALGAIVAVIAAAVVQWRGARPGARVAWAAVALTLLTLAMRDRDGVRRWIALGPLALHASSACAPWVLAALSASRSPVAGPVSMRAMLPLLVLQCVHLAQPDAAQSTAVTVAALVIAALQPQPVRTREKIATALALAALVALTVATWTRRDPLEAVAEVEQIVAVAMRSGWALAGLTISSAALWIGVLSFRRDALALGLAAYAASAMIVAVITERFPVPLLGAGAGPMLGAYAMIALLRAPSDARDRIAR